MLFTSNTIELYFFQIQIYHKKNMTYTEIGTSHKKTIFWDN